MPYRHVRMAVWTRAAILAGTDGDAIGIAGGGTPAFHLMFHPISEEQAV
ncbi:hypothetical protein STXM2123_294 [Streptomyces sp. F-3]|nr:hypothetical protein STXM2123_294 [Streptomyces sp. F-3]